MNCNNNGDRFSVYEDLREKIRLWANPRGFRSEIAPAPAPFGLGTCKFKTSEVLYESYGKIKLKIFIFIFSFFFRSIFLEVTKISENPKCGKCENQEI